MRVFRRIRGPETRAQVVQGQAAAARDIAVAKVRAYVPFGGSSWYTKDKVGNGRWRYRVGGIAEAAEAGDPEATAGWPESA